MNKSVAIARRLYAALKELDEAHISANQHEENEYHTAKIEEAEDALSDVLCDLKQWSIEP